MTPDYHPPELKWWEVILLTLCDWATWVGVGIIGLTVAIF